MKIALVAPPFLPCPPPGHGGIERVVAALARGLVAAGHEVHVFCHPDSTVPGIRHGYFRTVYDSYDTRRELAHTARAFAESARCDVLHNHTEAGVALSGLVGMPLVHTVHGTADYDLMRPVYEAFADADYVAISQDQRSRGPHMNWVATIYNGVDTDFFRPSATCGGYLLHLGTLARRKGTAEAIAIARRAGIPLVLAGIPDPDDRDYFEQRIRPEIDDVSVRYVGEVGGERKRRLLAEALALVAPVQWAEPFGLVLAEALACGVPVLALARGAIPEIVDDGKTGVLADDWPDLAVRAAALSSLRGERCRATVVERFSLDAMVRAYADLYSRLI